LPEQKNFQTNGKARDRNFDGFLSKATLKVKIVFKKKIIQKQRLVKNVFKKNG